MSSSSSGKHADRAASKQTAVAEPTFAERARTLVHVGRTGSLSTLSLKQPGFPYGSVMPYGLHRLGHPTFLISTMAMHTQNVQVDPRASLLVTQPEGGGDPLAASRVTLLGNILPAPEGELPDVRKLYTERYANSKHWIDFEDFSFYFLEILDVYYVGGFGVMGWVSKSEYYNAQPDPLADSAHEIIGHMNRDHADALIQLARAFAGVDSREVEMTSVDRFGFQIQAQTQDGTRGARVAFLREVSSAVEARNVLIDMVARTRQTKS